jgi:hypothetical protein
MRDLARLQLPELWLWKAAPENALENVPRNLRAANNYAFDSLAVCSDNKYLATVRAEATGETRTLTIEVRSLSPPAEQTKLRLPEQPIEIEENRQGDCPLRDHYFRHQWPTESVLAGSRGSVVRLAAVWSPRNVVAERDRDLGKRVR